MHIFGADTCLMRIDKEARDFKAITVKKMQYYIYIAAKSVSFFM